MFPLKSGMAILLEFQKTYKRICFGLFLLLVSSLLSSVTMAATFEHPLKQDESLWFLAKLYFGNGKLFEKILRDNELQSVADLKKNQILKIINPKFPPGSPDFKERYENLYNQRELSLANARGKAPAPAVNSSLAGLAAAVKEFQAVRQDIPAARQEGWPLTSTGHGTDSIFIPDSIMCKKQPDAHPGCR